jgi:hypothetical protein
MKRFLFILVVIALLVGGSLPVAVAQDGEDCPVPEVNAWLEVATQVLVDYDAAMANPGELETVATIQALRRTLVDTEGPACVEEASDTMSQMLNLTTDSIVAALLGDTALAGELSAKFTPLRADASQMLTDLKPKEDDGGELTGTIDTPEDGATVPSEVPFSGTYDNDDKLGGRKLWIFAQSDGNHMFYPQRVDGCGAVGRDSQESTSAFFGSWSVTGYLTGTTFTVYLMVVDEQPSAQLHEIFDGWCNANDFPGLTAEQVTAMGAEPLDSIKITVQ